LSILKKGISAISMLATIIVLAAAFLFGLATVVYVSLQGTEIKVPELVGKNLSDSRNELASLGLQVKVRASRPTTDPPDTVLEQLPKPGETVKTGQLIFVVTSKQTAQPEETPSSLKKSIEEDDTQTIEDMITDKPKKKSNSNSNSNKKKADTTRDVLGNTATSTTNSNTEPETGNSNKKEGTPEKTPEKGREPSNSQGRPASTPGVKPAPTHPGLN
jgi:beta-lactam-binding protein with PASTA domain